jgi:hypothetical protein
MKLAIFTLLLIAVCAALPSADMGEREYNKAIRDISGSLAANVGFACTFLKQILATQTLFPGTANYTVESTGMCRI